MEKLSQLTWMMSIIEPRQSIKDMYEWKAFCSYWVWRLEGLFEYRFCLQVETACSCTIPSSLLPNCSFLLVQTQKTNFYIAITSQNETVPSTFRLTCIPGTSMVTSTSFPPPGSSVFLLSSFLSPFSSWFFVPSLRRVFTPQISLWNGWTGLTSKRRNISDTQTALFSSRVKRTNSETQSVTQRVCSEEKKMLLSKQTRRRTSLSEGGATESSAWTGESASSLYWFPSGWESVFSHLFFTVKYFR